MLHDTKTHFPQSEQANKKFILIDAENAILGRLSSYIASVLMGKHKTNVTRSTDTGDNVIIINANKIAFTSDKRHTKIHHWHTGFIGGLKSSSMNDQIEKGKACDIIERAVKGMLPRGPLGYKMLRNLYVYNDLSHPHAAQKPTLIDFLSINAKNTIKRSS